MPRLERWLVLGTIVAWLLASPIGPLRPGAAAPSADPASAALRQTPTVLVEALVGQIRKLNPLLATLNPVDRDITALIFEGLTTTNDYGEIVPDLAESWTISPDALQVFVTLRRDILWQDGMPFTAEDVAFTLRLMSDPDFPGAPDLYAFWRTVEVEVLDPYLVSFRLTQPLASFLDQLRIGILPAHVLQGTPAAQLDRHPFNLAPIGTGPYQIEALTASDGQIDGIQLRMAPVYRQRPEGQTGYALDRIVFRTYPDAAAALAAYQLGEVNSIGEIPPALIPQALAQPGLSLYTVPQAHVGVLIYNWQRESMRFVRNPRARLALAHAVDRHSLVTQQLAGLAIPADSPLPLLSWAYQPDLEWPAYDLERARALLATADLTFEVPAEGSAAEPVPETTPAETAEGEAPEAAEQAAASTAEPTLAPTPESPPATPRIAILVLNQPDLVALARMIAASWMQLDFETQVDPVTAQTLQARLEAGDFDAALVEYSFEPSADPDPYVFWHQGQRGSGQNFGGMDDRRISEALEWARRDPYGINRIVHYRIFQTLFAERAPALVLYYPLYRYAADSRLQGVQLGYLSTPADRFRHVQDWYFEG